MEPPAPPSQKASFPTLEVLDPSTPHVFIKPTKCINEGPDVEKFLVSKAYRDIGMFVMQVEALVEEAPPDPGPRRFGNVSFRKWHQLIQERADDLMDEFIDNEQRLDYGTGHELSFFAFLACLWKLGAFKDGKEGGDIERSLVLGVFEPYLHVVRRVILTYTLEPAGSHGVWGLDDHSFLPYIFGSAQLTRPIAEDEPMPLEGSVRGAPKTGDVVKAQVVEEERQKNLYFSAVGFINDVKKGPFWEHSPILFDVSGVQDGWGKSTRA
ncbi:unnamed protein product [Parascedosporium putredinis]|uniref:Serine/threonine-protein phosphatase 2A activator n=1 Tax=Parascedosporium putredinis TaxID=1442378 RepID=A0A9P1ME60_9PEZI|nr:unnamed protein product [Parascedosporium putredinis]CAI7999845.1 unnamed protein product [Parascedosporium putredinis]